MRNDIIFGAVLPYVAFLIARHFGLSTVHALAIGSIFPIAVILITYVRNRRLAPVSVSLKTKSGIGGWPSGGREATN